MKWIESHVRRIGLSLVLALGLATGAISPTKAQAASLLQTGRFAGLSGASRPELVQYKTPEQEFRERQEQWDREHEREMDDQRTRQEEEIKRRSTWGAIAYSPSSGQFGVSWSHYFEVQAKRDALSECGRNDCEAITFSDSCLAIATGSNPIRNGWYDGEGESTGQAEREAIYTCMTHGEQNCKAVVSHCSPD